MKMIIKGQGINLCGGNSTNIAELCCKSMMSVMVGIARHTGAGWCWAGAKCERLMGLKLTSLH